MRDSVTMLTPPVCAACGFAQDRKRYEGRPGHFTGKAGDFVKVREALRPIFPCEPTYSRRVERPAGAEHSRGCADGQVAWQTADGRGVDDPGGAGGLPARPAAAPHPGPALGDRADGGEVPAPQ